MQVRFENVTMDYGDKEVLHELNFTISEHSLMSILGPSGCGKSTTLMLISGLIKPNSGHIYFDEKDVTALDAVKRKVGMVFQNYALYPHLTVLENIMFPLKMAHVKKADRLKRATELADLVQISEHIHKKPKQLSGGQQQRVAIARALAKKPQILLMDEPLSNLDARLRIEMREEIRRIQQETNITTVFVTHDQEEAMSISDQVMVLNDGHIQQNSEPQTLYDFPENQFVAQFLGNPVINILPTTNDVINTSSLNFPPSDLAKAVSIGVRPENLRAVTNEEQALFSGTVKHLERFGKKSTLKLINGDLEVTISDVLNHYELGNKVSVVADGEDIHLFDQAGQSIAIKEA